MRSKKEIKKKIAEVTAEFAKLPRFNFFGENNHEKRDEILSLLNDALVNEDFEEDHEDVDSESGQAAYQWALGNADEL
jgi:hypothetical protein